MTSLKKVQAVGLRSLATVMTETRTGWSSTRSIPRSTRACIPAVRECVSLRDLDTQVTLATAVPAWSTMAPSTYIDKVRKKTQLRILGRALSTTNNPPGRAQSSADGKDTGDSESARDNRSDSENSGDKHSGGDHRQNDQRHEDPRMDNDEQKVPKFQAFLYVSAIALGLLCLAATTKELLPTKMSPQAIKDRAHAVLEADPDTANHFGTPLKTYGRDAGRTREGRRNFIEHTEYKEPSDESNRVRIRFNVQGPLGHGMAYAEASDKMQKGEWVYLCVQDMRTGHVITLADNRAMLAAQASASSKEEMDAFGQMLGKRP